MADHHLSPEFSLLLLAPGRFAEIVARKQNPRQLLAILPAVT
eukprot:CAMPEP_0170186852 /NCGR_PEP_ID=MMETSP0040_2-20121228/40330_1 /TAXON_ID=641309 /ORGANISM="Lotharella oceanica, Strain CCMP622" /LENGTH=41 /DNA_ID= /DNA_START= /DNA_END= /DNA_ORIENTATION=